MPVRCQARLGEKPKVRGAPGPSNPRCPRGAHTCWTAARLWSWALVRCCCWSAAVCSMRCCCCAAYICCRYCAAVLGCRCSACWITFGGETWPWAVPRPPRHPPTLQCPPAPYLHGLAVGDAAVDGDLGPGRARGCSAGRRWGRATGAAGRSRGWELLILHGGVGAGWRAWVRLELGGRNRVRGYPWHLVSG